MKIDKNTTLAEFSLIAGLAQQGKINELFERLKNRPTPKEIAGAAVPENLNLITWAQFASLSSIGPNETNFLKPFEILFKPKENKLIFFIKEKLNIEHKKFDTKKLTDCKVFDVFGFLLFVKNDLERIVKLFESIKIKHTAEEIQAGIEKLNFGLFGTLDWYARRMGITDHKIAEQTPLIRIFQCMKNDNDMTKFQRRLQKIIADKNKLKTKK